MLAIICRASLTVVSKVIVSIIFASLKCRLIILPKIILKNQSVNITFDRVGSLCLTSFLACELNPYSAAEESHQLSICASSTALLFIFSFMFSAVESIFSRTISIILSIANISEDPLSVISPCSK